MLRKTLALISVYICIAAFGCAELIPLEKVYIDSSDVIVEKGQMYVAHDGALFQISFLGKDENGLFFSTPESALINPPRAWICPFCRTSNLFFQPWCSTCSQGDPCLGFF